FPDQPAAATYRQMGNGVNVGAVWHIFREHVKRDQLLLKASPEGRSILDAVRAAPLRPNEILALHKPRFGGAQVPAADQIVHSAAAIETPDRIRSRRRMSAVSGGNKAATM